MPSPIPWYEDLPGALQYGQVWPRRRERPFSPAPSLGLQFHPRRGSVPALFIPPSPWALALFQVGNTRRTRLALYLHPSFIGWKLYLRCSRPWVLDPQSSLPQLSYVRGSTVGVTSWEDQGLPLPAPLPWGSAQGKGIHKDDKLHSTGWGDLLHM